MALIFDMVFYTFKAGDPDGMPGAEGETYGFVGITTEARAKLRDCSATMVCGDYHYAADEATSAIMFDQIGEEFRFFM